jgi:hypothetical protein
MTIQCPNGCEHKASWGDDSGPMCPIKPNECTTALQAEIERLTLVNHGLASDAASYRQDIINSERRRAALERENSELRSRIVFLEVSHL